jgi:ketosteroid isomerase-like protein
MSEENVEVVRRFFEAWSRGDVAAFMRLAHTDGEFLLPRNILDGGSYRGPDGLRRAYADLTESWDTADIHISEIRDAGECVVVLGRNVNVGKHGGPRVEQESAFLLTVRDGKVAYERPYQSHAEALEAAGVTE